MPYNYYVPDTYATVCVQAEEGEGARAYRVVVFESGKNCGKRWGRCHFGTAEEAQTYLEEAAKIKGWLPCPE